MNRRSVLEASGVALGSLAVWWVGIPYLDGALGVMLSYGRYETVGLLYPDVYYPALTGWILAQAQPFSVGVWVVTVGWMLTLPVAVGTAATRYASRRDRSPIATAVAAVAVLFVRGHRRRGGRNARRVSHTKQRPVSDSVFGSSGEIRDAIESIHDPIVVEIDRSHQYRDARCSRNPVKGRQPDAIDAASATMRSSGSPVTKTFQRLSSPSRVSPPNSYERQSPNASGRSLATGRRYVRSDKRPATRRSPHRTFPAIGSGVHPRRRSGGRSRTRRAGPVEEWPNRPTGTSIDGPRTPRRYSADRP